MTYEYSQFFLDPVHGVYSGTESVWCLGSKIKEQRPSKIRNKKSLDDFRQEIKKQKLCDSIVESAKYLYKTLDFYMLY